VIDGADKLRDGAKINLRAEATPATPGTPAAAPGTDKSGGKKKRSDSEQKQ